MELEDFYKYISSAGVIIPDTSEVKQKLQEEFQSIFKGIDLTDETPAGRMVDALTMLMSSIIGINAQNANQFNLNNATGAYLDGLGANFLLSRLGATKTTVAVVLTGDANTTIPAGSLAMTNTPERALFVLDTDVVLDDSGTGIGSMSASEYGPVECKANTLTVIQSRVVGWSTINNPSIGIVGRNIESDDEYRKRIISARQIGNSFTESCASRILKINGVKSCRVLENGNAEPAIIDGVTMYGHSIFVCVDGITNSNKQEIARAIYNTKTAGCGFTVDGEQNYQMNVSDIYTGVEYAMMFCSPKAISTKVDIIVDIAGYEEEIVNGIVNAIESTPVGGYITVNNIIKTVQQYTAGQVNVISLVLKDSAGTTKSYIKLNGNNVGTIVPDDISVSIA